jgi:hypothetical protein
MKSQTPVLFLLGVLGLNCNNYGLLEKIENPNVETFISNNAIFVTSWATAGDMSGITGSGCANFSGVDKADCACTETAAKSNLRRYSGHRFYAWLSISGVDARCRVQGFSSNTCNTNTPPWYNTQGEIVAGSMAQLIAPPLQNAIRYSETKFDVGSVSVWTGTSGGTWAGSGLDCGSWANTGSTGTYGNPQDSATGGWSSTNNASCLTQQRLYCLASP